MIVIEVIFEAQQGARDEFISLMRRTMAASQQDLQSPDRFISSTAWQGPLVPSTPPNRRQQTGTGR